MRNERYWFSTLSAVSKGQESPGVVTNPMNERAMVVGERKKNKLERLAFVFVVTTPPAFKLRTKPS